MEDERNLPDPNDDLFVSHIDFRELNRKKNPVTGFKVLWRSIYSIEARKKFSKLLSRFKPDIVHLQNIHAHITPSIIFEAKRHNLPVVWTLHDYKLICPNSHFLVDNPGEICEACKKDSYYYAILKSCKKGSLLASTMSAIEAYAHRFMRVRDYVDAFLAPSNFLRDKLISRGFLKEKVYHLPLFLKNGMFQDMQSDDGYLLFLGKLEPIKGIYQLLEACKMAPEVQLILAGRIDRSLEKRLHQLLPRNAQYLGMKQGKELRRLLSNALAIVLPSLCYENQPFSILEAFANSKPVIASNLGGMTELVKDEERGLLVPPGDTQALADAMKWLVAHKREAKEMGRNGYQYAREVHSPESHYKELMEIYRKTINQK